MRWKKGSAVRYNFAYPRRSQFQGQVRENALENVIIVAFFTHGELYLGGRGSNLHAHGHWCFHWEKDILLFVSSSKAL